MPIDFTCVSTAPLQFLNLFTSTHIKPIISNRAKKFKLKAFELAVSRPDMFHLQAAPKK